MPPKDTDAALEMYITKIMTAVNHQLTNLQAVQCKDNLLTEERTPLRNLQQRMDIIIKPADKCYLVVVFSKEGYIRETDRQLNDQPYFQNLTVDLTSQHTSKVISICGLCV